MLSYTFKSKKPTPFPFRKVATKETNPDSAMIGGNVLCEVSRATLAESSKSFYASFWV